MERMISVQEKMLKDEITGFLKQQGADLVGVAPVEYWEENRQGHSFFPPSLVWPPARTAVVAGMALPLPVVETTPSSHHMELYRTCNRLLDEMALKTVNYLVKLNIPASFFPRDGFASVKLLKERPHAAFDHRFSAYFAGLGNLGWNNSLLTPEYGPRVRFVTIFLDSHLPPDREPYRQQLCIRCGLCVKLCPPKALKKIDGKDRTDVKDSGEKKEEEAAAEEKDKKSTGKVLFEREACRQWHEQLTTERRYPCGICIKVCPVGRDRTVYGAENRSRIYIGEQKALDELNDELSKESQTIPPGEPGVPDKPGEVKPAPADANRGEEEPSRQDSLLYRAWQHVRSFGSWK